MWGISGKWRMQTSDPERSLAGGDRGRGGLFDAGAGRGQGEEGTRRGPSELVPL